MNIVHFLPWYSPHGRGGTEIFLVSLARRQMADAHSVHIIAPNTALATASDAIDGIPVSYFPFPHGDQSKSFLHGERPHGSSEDFVRLVKGLAPDVVHMHGFYPHFLPYFAGLPRTQLILTLHLVNVVCAKQTLVDRRGEQCAGAVSFAVCSDCIAASGSGMARLAHRLALPVNSALKQSWPAILTPPQRRISAQVRALDFLRRNVHIDVLNPWFTDVLLLNEFDPERLSCFPNPLFEPRHFETLPMATDRRPLKLLFVGRLMEQKGVGLLVDALGSLERMKAQIAVTFVGAHTQPELVSRIAELRARGFDVTLEGEVPHDALAARYRAHDYLIFPSLGGEMLPLVIQESLLGDLPILAADIPSVRSLVHHEVNGYRFLPNTRELAGLLERLIGGELGIRMRYTGPRDFETARNEYFLRLYDDFKPRD